MLTEALQIRSKTLCHRKNEIAEALHELEKFRSKELGTTDQKNGDVMRNYGFGALDLMFLFCKTRKRKR